MPKDKTKQLFVHWWDDSSLNRTCHRNEPGLTAAESFLGKLKGNDLDGWFYQLRDSQDWVGPFNHLEKVMRALEKAVGGKILSTWD